MTLDIATHRFRFFFFFSHQLNTERWYRTGVLTHVPFCYLGHRTELVAFCTTVMALRGLFLKQPSNGGFVTRDTPQRMHTISATAPISSFIIDLLDRTPCERWPKGHRGVTLLVARRFWRCKIAVHLPRRCYALFHPNTSLQIKSSIFLQNNFSLHGAIFRPLVPFTFFFFPPESCRSSDSVQAAVNLSPPPPLSASQFHLPGCQMRGKTRECGAHLSRVQPAFHNKGA